MASEPLREPPSSVDTEELKIYGARLAHALRAYGYPMSDTAWANVSSGAVSASLEARRLHEAAARFLQALACAGVNVNKLREV